MAYPKSTWVKMKMDYASGDYSVRQLSEKYNISTESIEKHKFAEKWKKGSLAQKIGKKIEAKIETDMIALFAKHGMTPEALVKKLVDGMYNSEKREDGESVPDSRTQLEYTKEVNKITGIYAPVRKELAGAGGIPLIPAIAVESISKEQAAATAALAKKLSEN